MNKFAKSILSVSAAAIVATATLIPAGLVNAYGDNTGTQEGRPVYSLDDINAGKLGDKITFNSITKDGKIGDERNFVGARLTSGNASVYNANEINVEDGQTYTIRLYVHNNSPKGEDAIAKGVGVSFSLPTTVASEQTIIGYLDADAPVTPTRYWDEVTLKSSDDFYIEYVQGSAQYRNENGTFKLADTVINGKTLIGYTSMNGEIPGCFKYDGEATIQVKVHKSVNAKVAKTVRIKNSGAKFGESVEAKVGDEVEFQIEYVNLLSDEVKDVMIRDVLPNNLEYVENSTYLYNSNHKEGILLPENTLTTTGLNIGSYKAKGNAYIRFTAKVVDNSMACGSNQLVNWAASTVLGKVVKDDASVMVAKTCNDTPVVPNTPAPTTGKIVATGASDTVLISALGAGGLVSVVSYAIVSRRKF
ncbi:DUF11 domain-containing protein [Candidatus Saccharibacteria bacterium]|nr:DUF11 domain-containing protein [Candidatus Saccharibacteria bacterium]MBQ6149602.1 DUF11 domain-containing protein [Candidatus Saccharibacteria bacterium]